MPGKDCKTGLDCKNRKHDTTNPQLNPIFVNGIQNQAQSTKTDYNPDFAIMQSQSWWCRCQKEEISKKYAACHFHYNCLDVIVATRQRRLFTDFVRYWSPRQAGRARKFKSWSVPNFFECFDRLAAGSFGALVKFIIKHYSLDIPIRAGCLPMIGREWS